MLLHHGIICVETVVFKRYYKKSFGSGGFVCSLSDKELSEFQQNLEKSFDFDDPTKIKKGLCAGKQPEINIWVLNDHVQIDEDGNLIPLDQRKLAWQPIGGPCIETIGKSYCASGDLKSDVKLPLESSQTLTNLLRRMRNVFKHNFIPSNSPQLLSYALGISYIQINQPCIA